MANIHWNLSGLGFRPKVGCAPPAPYLDKGEWTGNESLDMTTIPTREKTTIGFSLPTNCIVASYFVIGLFRLIVYISLYPLDYKATAETISRKIVWQIF